MGTQQAIIMQTLFVRCFRCGMAVSLADVRRRETLVGVNLMRSWFFGWSPYRYEQYQPMDVCPRCDDQEEEWQRRKRNRVGMLIFGGGAFFFGYAYLSATISLIGAGMVALLFYFVSRPKKVELLPAERSSDGRR